MKKIIALIAVISAYASHSMDLIDSPEQHLIRRSVEAVRIALEDDGETVQLEFRDDGPGYPDEVLQLERYNVGIDLVQNIVRQSLHGELSLRNDPGAVTLIRFKVNGREASK